MCEVWLRQCLILGGKRPKTDDDLSFHLKKQEKEVQSISRRKEIKNIREKNQ